LVFFLTIVFLGAASVEGVQGAYSFNGSSKSSSVHLVNSHERAVWRALETATQPEFPLPSLLKAIPRPTQVLVDEGVALNANRVVQFNGREGEGLLHLKVAQRTQDKVTFTVVSDSSPIAHWVSHKSLTYHVIPLQNATELRVELKYDRLLAPAWFFDFLIGGAAYLAMDVLARDVKKRAELNAEQI